MKKMISDELIEERILMIRGAKVMLDIHLAELYEVGTKVLVQGVKRNHRRFPRDFMFQLTKHEFKSLRSQIVTSKKGRGGRRYLPYVFTEQGVAMLSSVLNSERAIQVNIQIMRIFTRLRKMLQSYKRLREKVEKMEKKYDHQFRAVFQTIRQLIVEEEKPKGKIGFYP